MQKRFPISQSGERNANGHSFGFFIFLEQLNERREGKGEKGYLIEVKRSCAWRIITRIKKKKKRDFDIPLPRPF